MLRENRPTSKKVYCRASNINHARTGMAMGSQFQQDSCPDTIATTWNDLTWRKSPSCSKSNMELATWMFFSAMSAMFSWVFNQPLLFRWPLPGFGHVFAGQDSPKKKKQNIGEWVSHASVCWIARQLLRRRGLVGAHLFKPIFDYVGAFDDLFEYFDDIIWCFF